MLARTRGRCSPDMLMEALNIERGHASFLLNRLIANNVIGPANALGLSQTRPVVDPVNEVRKLAKHALTTSEEQGVEEETQGLSEETRGKAGVADSEK